MLSIELRDRTDADRARASIAQVAAGATEDEALTALLADAHAGRRGARRARRALRAVGRARARRRSRARRRPRRSRRAFTTSARWRCPRRCIVEAVAAHAGREGDHAAARRRRAPRSWSRRATLAVAAPRRPRVARVVRRRRLSATASPASTFRSSSRIIAVADAYDAMTQDRAYRVAPRLGGRGRRAAALQPVAVRSARSSAPSSPSSAGTEPQPDASVPDLLGPTSSHKRTLLPRIRAPFAAA